MILPIDVFIHYMRVQARSQKKRQEEQRKTQIAAFSNDCRSTMSRPWSRNYWSNWEDHSYRHWQSSSQAPPSFTPDLPAHWKDSDVHYDENCLHVGTHCLKPFSPQLGLENGASMVWIPCKYRWRRCEGTKPRNSPCDHFLQVAFWELSLPAQWQKQVSAANF